MRWPTVLLVGAVLGGCGGGEGPAVEPGRPDELVLQPADVPELSTESSSGDHRGWAVTFAGAREAVESTAAIHETNGHAQDRLQARGARVGQPIGEPGIGDESLAGTAVAAGERSYTLMWREENVTGLLFVRGPEGRHTFADVVALAEKQQRRIEAAASG
jgi:hypothetical protein